MRIAIRHTTTYRFTSPAWHGLQRLRLTPRDCAVQKVVDWRVAVAGGAIEAEYVDHNQNGVTLVSFGSGAHDIAVTCEGVVETRDTAGVVGKHTGFMPLWAFLNHTERTRPGPRLKALVNGLAGGDGDTLGRLHALSEAVSAAVRYEAGHTHVDTPAEAALAAGHGVCQDHAHIFIGAARMLGIPARYVSGYLLMDGREEQEAGHGWAEAHVAGLGWVGFDVSNAICPDERYVRLAVGVDYHDAAPVTGITRGGAEGALDVALSVAQQLVSQ